MLRLLVGPADLAATRFAVSPVFELAMLLRALVGSPPRSLTRRFGSGLDALRDDDAVRAFVFLHGPGYGASFAAPPPTGMEQTIEADLRALRGAEPADVATGLREVLRRRRPDAAVGALLAAPDVTSRLADGVQRAWDRLLAPDWARVRAVLERDVRFRAERLARDGWSAALSGVHAGLAWRDGGVEIESSADGVEDLAGRGLLLVPSVFLVAQRLAVIDDAPWQPTVVYPARGAGLVLEEAPAPVDPLAPLLGRTRAGLLLALAVPSSTTQLARLTGASLGATGDHLRVLLDAGLVTRSRLARSVVYRRTPLGDALAGP
ncbi:DUF5937 family protein [Amnibacterium endophyticum]|uniref:DUF5937 family protein n=1 Tax=Amnibacterium endophyticum TaxID=2109337 RepID=A0ABW4LIB1_9MICO